MKKRLMIISLALLFWAEIGSGIEAMAQRSPSNEFQLRRWTIKVHGYSSRQRITNIWMAVPPQPDTVKIISLNSDVDGYGRGTFGVLVARDVDLTRRLTLQAGLGYRQKGFSSTSRLNLKTGVAERLLPRGSREDNLFHYASSELSLQWKTLPKRSKLFYLRSGQRLDYLMDFRSAFWGNNYSDFTQFEYSIFGAVGFEYHLKRKLENPKKSGDEKLYRPSRILFVEIEGTPRMFNIHRLTWTPPYARMVDLDGELTIPSMYGPIQPIVRNTGFGIVAGVKF